MFKWSIEASIATSASPKNIWNLWSNVSSWSIWDSDGLEWVKLEGDFAVGTKGTLKPKEAIVFDFI